MNAGIIVFSQTGNTYSVALQLREKLLNDGHEVVIERISPVGEQRLRTGNVLVEQVPAIDRYDVLFFGSPVQGFALAPAMTACMRQLPAFAGKKAACFITMSSPFKWMGGKNAVKQLQGFCEAKAGLYLGAEIIGWSPKKTRDQRIKAAIGHLAGLIQSS